MKRKKVASFMMAAVMVLSLTVCENGESSDSSKGDSSSADIPTIDQIKVGDDYQDLKADIKILTNRTDIVDTKYKEYADEFHKLYPNIIVTYETITDYDEGLNLCLTNGDWGDICFMEKILLR